MVPVLTTPSVINLDGVSAAYVSARTIGDMYDLWQTQWAGEEHTEFYGILVTEPTDPGDDTDGVCNARHMQVCAEPRIMYVKPENRTMVVPCKC